MAGSPKFKLYSANKEYMGCMKYAEDAAAMVSCLGEGATVKYDHGKVLWTEGGETLSAFESYDRVAEIMNSRR